MRKSDKAALAAILCAMLLSPAKASSLEEWRLFGSLQFMRPMPPQWLDVLEREKESPPPAAFVELEKRARGKEKLEILRIVDAYWNEMPYKSDREAWGKHDYWATPAEFEANSGDCEDYAIAKYFTLKALGFEPKDMRIAIVEHKDAVHAVLAVMLGDDIWLLDSLAPKLRRHGEVKSYRLAFSVNEDGMWAHVYPRKIQKK